MDEQPFIQNALEDLVACGAKYPHELAGLTAAQLDDVRQKYWARVKKRVTLRSGQRLVDKNPLNILRLAVIRRLFPNAKIVLAVRHPFDVILSCYMQHFRAPDFALICRDLPSLATAYAKTLDYWYAEAELLRPQVREVRYETLVAQFEPEVRALAEFLELPWNDALLSPQQKRAAQGLHQHAELCAGGQARAQRIGRSLAPLCRARSNRWNRSSPGQLERWGYAGVREQQVGRKDVFVAGHGRDALVLVHPERREHQQTPGFRLHVEIKLREPRLAAFRDIVQIPQQDEITVRHMIDRIEMQLEALGETGGDSA
jgi:hypothetical protein